MESKNHGTTDQHQTEPFRIEQFQIGETEIAVSDRYCRAVSGDEAEKIIRELAEELYPYISALNTKKHPI